MSSFSRDLLSLLTVEQFDKKVLSILEKQELFIPEIRHIIKYPIIEKSTLLMKRAIANNPQVLMYLRNFNLDLIDIASRNGFSVNLDVIKGNPELRNNN